MQTAISHPIGNKKAGFSPIKIAHSCFAAHIEVSGKLAKKDAAIRPVGRILTK
jgi:hypothetical protein